MKRTLLLNGDYRPLRFIEDTRALCMVLDERAYVPAVGENGPSIWADERLTSPSMSYEIPAIVVLNRTVKFMRRAPRFQKKILYSRDMWKCQYCGDGLIRSNVTVDHVIPRSKGGPTSWANCVTACWTCNLKKGNRTPAEARMPLLAKPEVPTLKQALNIPRSEYHPDWKHFLND